MFKSFVLIALHGALGEAQWDSLLMLQERGEPSADQFNELLADGWEVHGNGAPLSGEARQLANSLGLPENGLSHDASNALDEMATAMLDQNFNYIDEEHDDIPVFHVVHSSESSSQNELPDYHMNE